MTTHHCKTYPHDPYCNCYNQTGEHMYHFKQFDTESQTYNCCHTINASLTQLRKLATPEGSPFNLTARDFFNSLSSQDFSGCCYNPYFLNPDTGISDTEHFVNNYGDLHHEYTVSQTLYNQFIASPAPSPVMSGNNVTCPDGNFPYILSFRSSGQLYYNYAFFCSTNTNDSFPSINVGGEEVDFRVTRFYDNSSGQPCTSSTCQLITNDTDLNNFGDIVNQGNHQPVYHNNPKKINAGFIASGVLAILLLLVGVYVFYEIHKKMDELEKQRIN